MLTAVLAATPLLLAQESAPVPPTPFDRVIVIPSQDRSRTNLIPDRSSRL
ncbi:MAG: hypothetical protein ACI8QZ_002817 [Chlamydiales bacterium]|jgi:hypothetical protein